ncbi:MAG TPA: transaldolase [Gemmatimonadales bacterium]|jgi:transaldolase|nr:transaldolase [Gemmatimonadales bacterium]
MSTNTLVQLGQLGQSPWYDFITRDLVHSGELARLIRDEGLRGMTSNPTIFEKAVGASTDYDEDIRSLAKGGAKPAEIVESLMVADVQAACDVFRPVYDASGHGDGTVSIEVSPVTAFDTAATIAEAHRLWQRVNRPNLMVKIPGTAAGLPAITQCLADGININITLLFGVDRYKQVIDAFRTGLEQRAARGEPINQIHSVASFFVSRVDGQTDPALAKIGFAAKGFLHRMAIANAMVAYDTFGKSLLTPRWQALVAKGAKAQRPLWASTSTKDHTLSDVYYVEALVASDTVDTIPPDTYRAYLDHGRPEVRITPDAEHQAAQLLADYEKLGAPSLASITAFLEEDGVKKFTESWNALLKRVEQKASALAA